MTTPKASNTTSALPHAEELKRFPRCNTNHHLWNTDFSAPCRVSSVRHVSVSVSDTDTNTRITFYILDIMNARVSVSVLVFHRPSPQPFQISVHTHTANNAYTHRPLQLCHCKPQREPKHQSKCWPCCWHRPLRFPRCPPHRPNPPPSSRV